MTDRRESSERIWLAEAQLRVLAGSRTQDVWNCFQGSNFQTAGEIQARLGLESKTVYYQLRKLVKAGLLRADDSAGRAVRYGKLARTASMPSGYQGTEYERLAAGMVAAKLRHMIRQFERAAAGSEQEPDLVDLLLIMSERLQLSPEGFNELTGKIRELFEEYAASPEPAARPVRILLVSAPEMS